MVIVKGLPEEALNFLSENSDYYDYQPGQRPIGCGKSDGIVSFNAQLDEEWVYDSGDGIIKLYLFSYSLKNGIKARDRVQEIKKEDGNTVIYTQLEIINTGNNDIPYLLGERIKWKGI